jgi:hypothetical protein
LISSLYRNIQSKIYFFDEEVIVMFKKFLVGLAGSATVLGFAVAPAFAANDYCGASSTGCSAAATAGAQCGTGAASGSFGAFGPDNNFAGGANGYQTGLNNSAVCGNR